MANFDFKSAYLLVGHIHNFSELLSQELTTIDPSSRAGVRAVERSLSLAEMIRGISLQILGRLDGEWEEDA